MGFVLIVVASTAAFLLVAVGGLVVGIARVRRGETETRAAMPLAAGASLSLTAVLETVRQLCSCTTTFRNSSINAFLLLVASYAPLLAYVAIISWFALRRAQSPTHLVVSAVAAAMPLRILAGAFVLAGLPWLLHMFK